MSTMATMATTTPTMTTKYSYTYTLIVHTKMEYLYINFNSAKWYSPQRNFSCYVTWTQRNGTIHQHIMHCFLAALFSLALLSFIMLYDYSFCVFYSIRLCVASLMATGAWVYVCMCVSVYVCVHCTFNQKKFYYYFGVHLVYFFASTTWKSFTK